MAEALTQDILNLVVPCNPKLSPDGRSVVYGSRRKLNHKSGDRATASIWIANTASEKSARQLTSGTSMDLQPKWSPDGTWVAFLSDCAEPGKSSAIYLVQPEAGNREPKAVTPVEHSENIIKYEYSPDGKAIAFLACPEKTEARKAKEKAKDDAIVWGQDLVYTHLWLATIATAAIKPIFNKSSQVVDFSWSPDGTQIAFVTHQTPHIESKFLHGADVSIINISSGEARKVCHIPGGVWALKDLTWSNSSLYFLSYHNLRGDTSGLAIYSVNTLDAAAPISITKISHDDGGCPYGLLAAGGDVVVYVQDGMEDQLRLVHDGRVLISQPKRIVDFDVIRSQDDGKILPVIISGDVNNPSEVIFINASGQQVQLSNHGADGGLAGKTFGHCNFISCRSLDQKETLDGIYLTPAQLAGPDGKPSRPLPTFVYMHGGPYCRWTDAFDEWDAVHIINPVYLQEGFGVLFPNYRGGSSRGRRFASYARAGAGESDEPDVVALTQHAIESGLTDPARLVAGGWSQGGHLAYLSAVRNGAHGLGWRFLGVMVGAGITDWSALALESDVGFWQAQVGGGAPWRFESRADQDGEDCRAPRRGAIWEFGKAAEEGRIPPMPLVHGERDARTPIAQAWGFRRALEEAGLPFEFVTYPREGHIFTERKHIEDLLRRTLDFLRAHLS